MTRSSEPSRTLMASNASVAVDGADFMSSVKDLVNCLIKEIFACSPRLRHPLDQLQGEWVQSEVAT